VNVGWCYTLASVCSSQWQEEANVKELMVMVVMYGNEEWRRVEQRGCVVRLNSQEAFGS
jgi:hypothetical protein